jgi:ribose 5-phosphate isomerase A
MSSSNIPTTLSNLTPQEQAKRHVVKRVVDDYITRDRMKLGIGSGSTMHILMKTLADLLINDPRIHTIYAVPTSVETKHLLILHSRRVARATNNNSQLIVTDLDCYPILDASFDGCDEVDTTTVNCIKGAGACIVQERLVANASKHWIIVGDASKASNALGTIFKKGVPVECVPYGTATVIHHLLLLGATDVSLKQGNDRKSGPIVTDSNGYILNASFPKSLLSADKVVELDKQIRLVTGVVTTGLFVDIASKAYIGHPDGNVEIFTAKREDNLKRFQTQSML